MSGDMLCTMANSHATSEAEEMYLITVARAIEDGVGPPVPVSTISGVLEVSSVSANQMIKKLEASDLVAYTPYKGVTLTRSGDQLANTVLRNRRLWGRFLADHLGLTPAKADEVACDMEHVTPDMVADRLDIATVVATDVEFSAFLQAQGINEGTEVTVLGVGADGSVLVKSSTGMVHLAAPIVGGISVGRG
jgi:DtxR family Mn-dependent transcriptional regulator